MRTKNSNSRIAVELYYGQTVSRMFVLHLNPLSGVVFTYNIPIWLCPYVVEDMVSIGSAV